MPASSGASVAPNQLVSGTPTPVLVAWIQIMTPTTPRPCSLVNWGRQPVSWLLFFVKECCSYSVVSLWRFLQREYQATHSKNRLDSQPFFTCGTPTPVSLEWIQIMTQMTTRPCSLMNWGRQPVSWLLFLEKSVVVMYSVVSLWRFLQREYQATHSNIMRFKKKSSVTLSWKDKGVASSWK